MLVPVIAALLAAAQPAPAPQPAESDYQTEVADPDDGATSRNGEAGRNSGAGGADEPNQAGTGDNGDADEELICRRRLIPSEGFGQRFRTQRICKTREEWEEGRLRR